MDTEAYLSRIKFDGTIEANLDTLISLHLAHMRTVPFENLDIRLGIAIELDFERIYRKVIASKRGGFCYELNGLFGQLLTLLGFDVRMFSARVYGEEGKPGPEFDHMLLLVNKEFIADVGFGDSFTRPLIFEEGEQEQETGRYRLTEKGGTWLLERENIDGWSSQYLFSAIARSFDEFEDMCRFQQTSPDSIFTQKVVCSMAAENGRDTYANGRFIETLNGKKQETIIPSPDALKSLLSDRFGFELDGGYEQLLSKPEGTQ